jgi:hypothetical protein
MILFPSIRIRWRAPRASKKRRSNHSASCGLETIPYPQMDFEQFDPRTPHELSLNGSALQLGATIPQRLFD